MPLVKYTDKGTITFGLSWKQTEPDTALSEDPGYGYRDRNERRGAKAYL